VGKLLPSLEDCVRERDYAGALAILDFERKTAASGTSAEEALERRLWVGYCAFHAGDYEQAQEVYQGLIDELGQQPAGRAGSSSGSSVGAVPPEVHLYLACCLYYLQEYEQAERAAQRYDPGTSGTGAEPWRHQQQSQQQQPHPQQEQQQQRDGSAATATTTTTGSEQAAATGDGATPPLPSPGEILRNRLLFHIAHKLGNENKLLLYHQRLTDTMEDQLSLAAIHFLRSHFQEVRAVAVALCGGKGRERG
jgi:hypothetical protein